MWFKGPEWLRKIQEFWPKQSDFVDELKKLEENEEYVKEIRESVFTLLLLPMRDQNVLHWTTLSKLDVLVGSINYFEVLVTFVDLYEF